MVITISTPAVNDWDHQEDPHKILDSSINQHIHIIHEDDALSSFLTTSSTYRNLSENGKSTHNIKVSNTVVKIDGGFNAHTQFPNHKDLAEFLQTIPVIDNTNNTRV